MALNFGFGAETSIYPYYLDTDYDRIGMVIYPAEAVSVIGFPFGLSSSGRLPVWATGFLAQELSLITPENPVFLIDCRTRSGQSGSAVIAFRPAGFRSMQDGKLMPQLHHAKAWEFLGIYSGRVNAESDLGRVWHVSVLGELVDTAVQAQQAHGPTV